LCAGIGIARELIQELIDRGLYVYGRHVAEHCVPLA
jgi:hypothetical protein